MFGYKAFNSDLTCRDFQYEVGKEYSTSGEIELCRHGFHFCENIIDCLSYYSQPDARFAIVEALGKTIRSDSDSVCVTDRIRIVMEIPRSEAVRMSNVGVGNSGICNSGYGNHGDWNSGNGNRGNGNSGDRNSGSCNSMDCNFGDRNSGSRNHGNGNSGTGNYGRWNSGNHNYGTQNVGHSNSGDRNSGHWNLGNRNSGTQNIGNQNSGIKNYGDRNAGCHNLGYVNSGNGNSGDGNSGDRNHGDRNTGDWNASSCNTGCFMTVRQTIPMFNRPSDWTFEDWHSSEAYMIMSDSPMDSRYTEWISSKEMTKSEKEEHPEHEKVGGYLKTVIFTADRQTWWDGLGDDEKKTVMNLPNFDPDVFYECTGIRV